MLPVAKDREHPADGDPYRIVQIAELDVLDIGRYRTTPSITAAAAQVGHGRAPVQMLLRRPITLRLERMQQEERSVFPRKPNQAFVWVWV